MTPQSYVQGDRIFKVSCEGQKADQFLLERFSGKERVSRPFTYVVDLLSEDKDVDPGKLIGKHLSIEVTTSSGKPVWIDGLVRRFTTKGQRIPLWAYQAEIVPWCWFLSLSQDCRIYQDMKK